MVIWFLGRFFFLFTSVFMKMSDDYFCIQKDEFICAICLSVWIGHDPRILPCQHTFCYNCLKRLIYNTRTCPVCRAFFRLPGGEIKKLPKNILDKCVSHQKSLDAHKVIK